ncbi:hypothetical protein EAI_12804 [Harpegnathos saltator]|uniref:Uncharacterized protein n=1 Tax=Harpegnathos saltator TaxID=610380 RepID=E2B945_HARSA|nr:hypothetical protein EAI_12804 [Harpegnathos saltator]
MSSVTRKAFAGSFHHHNQEYDSATTATTSSPEPEEYTYEGAIRGYVSRVSQNIPRRSLSGIDSKLEAASKSSVNGPKTTSLNDDSKSPLSVVKVDILKRREVFEKASQKSNDSKANNRLSGDFTGTKSIKERLSSLEKQKQNEAENGDKGSGKSTLNRLSGDMSSIRERLTHLEKQASERESKSSVHRKLSTEDLETVRPLRERLSTLEKYSSSDESSVPTTTNDSRHNGELTARTIKDRLSALDAARSKDSTEKRQAASNKHAALCFRDQENRIDTSTPSERSSSPDSEYRVPRAIFHRSLDSLDADASSGPDTFERVQSLEELDYSRRYPASSSSAELLNDTDREDSGIHTADVSCSVSQADEPIDEEIVHTSSIVERRETASEDRVKPAAVQENASAPASGATTLEASSDSTTTTHQFASHREAVAVNKGTADTSGELSTNKSQPQTHVETTTNSNTLRSHTSVPRATAHLSPKVPQRESAAPDDLAKARAFGKDAAELKAESDPSPSESVVSASLKLSIEQARSKFVGPAKRQNPPKEQFQPPSDLGIAETYQLSFPAVRATIGPSPESPASKPAPSRAASKIPTPLSRKGAKSSPTSSDSALTSSPGPSAGGLKASPAKSHPASSKPASTTSQAACSLPSYVESPQTEALATSASRIPSASARCHEEPTLPVAATERRRTVVEVCEKVVVPQGKAPTTPPVTPFITVNRVNEKQTSEVRHDQQQQQVGNASKKS